MIRCVNIACARWQRWPRFGRTCWVKRCSKTIENPQWYVSHVVSFNRGHRRLSIGEGVHKQWQSLCFVLAVRGIYFLLFSSTMGPELSILGPDPSRSLNYGLQLRSVKFSASDARQVSRSKISNTQDWVYYVYTKRIGSQAFSLGSRPTQKV